MIFVLTILGVDRPGLVDDLAGLIAEHQGNWLDSRLAHLSGHFTGLLRVDCPEEKSEALSQALRGLGDKGLTVLIAQERPETPTNTTQFSIDIVGHDQPGIVRRLSSTLTNAGANVESLETSLEPAPMSGHPLFHAVGKISIPEHVDLGELIGRLEQLGPDLSIDISQ